MIGNIAAADKLVLFRNATVYDGSARPGRVLDILVRNQHIEKVAPAIDPGTPDTEMIEARGLVLAPGFIDLHTHSDSSIVAEASRDNLNYLTQGVTTIVTGNCGGGATDTARLYAAVDKNGAGTNVVHLIPHGSIREIVMKNAERAPSPQELAQMQSLVEREMQAGAWGISTGLIYIPGKFADIRELIALSRTVAAHGGIYASHIRDEGDGLLKSIGEAITIGREAGLPAHISHLKASGKANWGLIRQACEQIEKARRAGQAVTADQYPYIASSTRLSAMVAPDWARVISAAELAEKLKEPAARKKLAQEIHENLTGRDGGHSIVISRYAKNPKYIGKPLDEIGQMMNRPAEEIVIEILLAGDAGAISFGMSEADVLFGMQQPWVATASDGGAHKPVGPDKPHPRVFGTFPRKIRYALDDKVISLEQAIHAATALPAEILGLKDRGRIAPGLVADLVIFDPNQFRDKSTFADSTQYADGVKYLMVNGALVIDQAKFQNKLAGRALRHASSRKATVLIEADSIWTGDQNKPVAQAIAIRDDVIIGVGKADELQSMVGPSTKIVKYPAGSFVTPGLIDAHVHLSSLGANLDELDLRGLKSQEDVAQAVLNRAAQRPGDGWIVGRNWDQSLWPGQIFPDKTALDKALPNRSVWLVRVDGHAGWANTEAMKRSGVTSKSKVPADGQMMLDKTGQPTGLFIDGAMGLVSRAMPPVDDETVRRRMLFAQAECLKNGLTSVHDAGLDAQDQRVLEQMDQTGLLQLRVYGMASAPANPAKWLAEHQPGLSFAGRGRYQLRAMKFFMDGAMGSRGALMFEDYADDHGNRGLQLIDMKTYDQALAAALRHGWQVCTHAIGDKGNALVLDSMEKAFQAVPRAEWANPDPRWRVEHAQVVRRADVPRFARLGIIASMQPSHASSDQRWADLRLGPERARGAYAWSWFYADGVKMAFGSDFPVEVATPLWGLFGAVTRQQADGTPPGGWRPEHKLTMQQALAGFTAGSAHAEFAEKRLGRLAPGFQADLAVFDRNLLGMNDRSIMAVQPLATWVAGEKVAGP